MPRTANYDCPICGQYMDFIAITYRNSPYIDGKCYKRMCFCCAHVPQQFIHHYDAEGNIAGSEGPFFDHKHVKTPEDLVMEGTAHSLEEAKRCCRGVRRALEEAGAVALRKLSLVRPDQEYDFNDEFEEEQRSKWAKSRKGLKRKRV